MELQRAERQVGALRGLGINQSNGIQSRVFGPVAWAFLHMVSLNYPLKVRDADRKTYRDFLLRFGAVLPCKKCREQFASILENRGFDATSFHSSLDSRPAFIRFCYELHNEVNGVRSSESHYAEMVSMYEALRASCGEQTEREGCARPLHNGRRGQTIIRVVPFDEHKSKPTFSVSDECRPSSTG